MSVASPQAAESTKKLDTMDESPENRSRSNSRSKSRSVSRSKSRSRSRSKEKKRSRSRSASPRRRSRSRSRTYSPPRTDSNGRRVVSGRIHVSDFSSSLSKRELERAFEKYGKIVDLWMATYPPYYAFITYKHPEDAERAIRKMNEEYVSGNRVRVAHALPKRETRRFDSGRFGGFDRWGGGGGGGGPRRRYSRSPPRRSGRSRSRDRYQSRRNRSRSRSSSR